ncbi:hypothetical protein [Methylobacterium radiodurans]|uniref:Uncharacterized protein n=1 Tax=Methylobacterium radiodurans TaxID=2202828 RepID=A0A2U8VLH4_9HYPH|nr:hypothetical protein [Methylobacterium radiodurans]AWN34417.1 hypothetical protein DK427_00545 [Methylobacterium radiodurans]
MRMIHLAVLAATAAATLATPVVADDILHVTPPLYREQARTRPVRPATELATTPHPVSAAPGSTRIVAAAVR